MAHAPRPPQDTHTHPADNQPLPDSKKLPASASHILGQTSKVNPRVPRPSSSASTLSPVPHSYAYGASGTPPHISRKQMPNTQTADTPDSASLRSRSSLGYPTTLPADESVASASSEKKYAEPARVRYARLTQRLQNTGSASTPSQAAPKVTLTKPTSTLLNDTSVNIAIAFERARSASRTKHHNLQNLDSERLIQSNKGDLTSRDRSQSPDPQQPVIIDQNAPFRPDTNEFSENVQSNKKRKKGRRSLDPSFKYRRGDSATSDSEAGEGIADKRLRREKKARLDAEQLKAQSSKPKRATIKRRKRKSAQSIASEDLTDSNEDVGPGIAATRGRRVPKVKQPNDEEEKAATQSSNLNIWRRKKVSGTRTTDNNIDLSISGDSEMISASNPEASQPPEEDSPNKSHDNDLTAETADSSRPVLRHSTADSYDFEEERIVEALENQSHQQEPIENSGLNDSVTDIAQDTLSNNYDFYVRDRVRSDSGMREMEEIVASNSHRAEPRVLPLPIPYHHKPLSPLIEEPELESVEEPKIPMLDGIGTKLANKLIALRSFFSRFFKLTNKFTWLALLSSVLMALIINSIRSGDITFSTLSSFSPFQRVRPMYSAPKEEIHNAEELIERLKSLESAVSSISSEHQSNSKNLQQSLQSDKREFDYKVGRLELKLEEEEKLRGGLADKMQQKVEQGMQVLRNDLESVIIGHRHDHGQLEKVKETVEGLSDKVVTSVYSSRNSVSREEVRTMMDHLWSLKARDGASDLEQVKQKVLKAVLNHINQDGYLTKADLVKILNDELRVVTVDFGQQLESKLQKLRQEIQVPPTRSRNIEAGEAIDQVQELIDDALERYSQDQIGKRDFALYSGGARVIPQLTSKTYQLPITSWSHRILNFFTGSQSVLTGRGPVTALSPETGLGMCWPMAGSTGQIGIYLSRKVLLTEVTIEHVDKTLAFELDSSPKEIEVWSIEDSKKLLDVVYDPSKSPRIQTFQIPRESNYLSSQSVILGGNPHEAELDTTTPSELPILRQSILFKIKSNHGNPFYTCIYRLRVHGLMESELHQ